MKFNAKLTPNLIQSGWGPQFGIHTELSETHYLMRQSSDAEWIDVGRDAYMAALETRRVGLFEEQVTTLNLIVGLLRNR